MSKLSDNYKSIDILMNMMSKEDQIEIIANAKKIGEQIALEQAARKVARQAKNKLKLDFDAIKLVLPKKIFFNNQPTQ